jgi:hypothetical protein
MGAAGRAERMGRGIFVFFANPVTSRMETTKETMNPPPTARGQPIETNKQLQK